MAQAKKVKAMLAALKVGDEVSTTGGLLGKITKLMINLLLLKLIQTQKLKYKNKQFKPYFLKEQLNQYKLFKLI